MSFSNIHYKKNARPLWIHYPLFAPLHDNIELGREKRFRWDKTSPRDFIFTTSKSKQDLFCWWSDGTDVRIRFLDSFPFPQAKQRQQLQRLPNFKKMKKNKEKIKKMRKEWKDSQEALCELSEWERESGAHIMSLCLPLWKPGIPFDQWCNQNI